MKLADADRKKLPPLLDQLAGAVEDLLASGLTTASDATRQTLQIAFQEASRLRLLRLGSTLRVANDELGRFTRNQPDFSRKRLCFFLNRAWLLSRGLARALAEKDEAAWDRLLWMPASEPVDAVAIVTLGVGKKVATGAFVAFEFRLRTLAPAGRLPAGQRLTWSCVFPIKPGSDIPAEGYLHLPQKQKFNPSIFLDKKVLIIAQAAVAVDEWGNGRLSLGDASKVSVGDDFDDWERFLDWDGAAALKRIQAQQPGPLDLDIEMQEEVLLREWDLQDAADRDDSQWAYPLAAGPLVFDAVVSKSLEGQALRARLEEQRKKKKNRPPLFGLLHYEKCRLVLQPLTFFGKDGPEYLTISDESIDRAALLKALKFT
jgi:hypothetical protein